MKSFREYLTEEFNPTSLTLYTRCNIQKYNQIMELAYKNYSHVHFYMYDDGMYCFSDLESALNPDAERRYGKYILKFTIPGGTKNFFYTSYKAYKQAVNSGAKNGVYADNVPFIDEQLKKFNISKKELLEKRIYPASKFVYKPAQNADDKLVSAIFKKRFSYFEGVSDFQGFVKYLETTGYIPDYIKGIEYYSNEDKNAFIVFDNKAIVPLVLYDTKGNKVLDISKEAKAIGYKNSKQNLSVKKIEKNKKKDVKNLFLAHANLDKIPDYASKDCLNFNVSFNNIKTLENCPRFVYGNFNVSNNNLTSLKGFPEKVGKDIHLNNNKLTSLEDIPISILSNQRNFYCSNNKLTSLKGCPEELYDFNCSNNKLINLEGGPIYAVMYDCSSNHLTSLSGAPEGVFDTFLCDDNKLTSLNLKIKSDLVVFSCMRNNIPKKEIIRFSKEHPGTSVISDFGCFVNGKEEK